MTSPKADSEFVSPRPSMFFEAKPKGIFKVLLYLPPQNVKKLPRNCVLICLPQEFVSFALRHVTPFLQSEKVFELGGLTNH